MEKHDQKEENQNLPKQQGDAFEIFILEKIEQPALQHDQ